jgi:hypothetical protein
VLRGGAGLDVVNTDDNIAVADHVSDSVSDFNVAGMVTL